MFVFEFFVGVFGWVFWVFLEEEMGVRKEGVK